MSKKSAVIAQEQIEHAVLALRGEKVLLDTDLAKFYGVSTKALNQAVQRNLTRFPDDFLFRLTPQELAEWRSQIVTSKTGRGRHRKYLPYAFTEQGVAMLSSVLRSPRAVAVNIEIMRAFVRLRKALAVNAELARRLDEVEKHLGEHDEQFIQVIRAIRQLMEPPARPRRRIGFHASDETLKDDKPASTGRDKAKRSARNRSKQAIRNRGSDE